jgi:preprotein translocase subunit SecY
VDKSPLVAFLIGCIPHWLHSSLVAFPHVFLQPLPKKIKYYNSTPVKITCYCFFLPLIYIHC